jgi:hypothetical protein
LPSARPALLGPGPRHCVTIFLEKLLYRLPAEPACSIVDLREIRPTRADDLTGQTPFDVIINCAGDFDSLPPAHRILTPLFDQAPSELGALEALLDGRDVTIGVFEGSGLGRVVSSGTVACESRKVVTRALNNVCSRVGDLVLKALKTKSAAPSAGAVPVNPRVLDQTAVGRIVATKPKAACGVHTYNQCDLLEVIDVCGDLNGAASAVVSYRATPAIPSNMPAPVKPAISAQSTFLGSAGCDLD